MSGVALAPSGGRAAGALLTVILRGSMLDRREDGSSPMRGAVALASVASSCAAGFRAWSAPTPPWPEGPKSGTRRPAHRVPGLTRSRAGLKRAAPAQLRVPPI